MAKTRIKFSKMTTIDGYHFVDVLVTDLNNEWILLNSLNKSAVSALPYTPWFLRWNMSGAFSRLNGKEWKYLEDAKRDFSAALKTHNRKAKK